ncbi:MAG: PKD domain-containing protein, partial [Bacteroidales bacterium]|nr:PKD domain-containing protein [Bacteroidales bacterium]
MRNLKIIGLFLLLFFSMSGTNIAQILTPDQIPGLSLWLRSDTNVVLNGANVTQWNDCSGNNNNASQSIVVSQPMLVSDALNGLPVVRFDGVNDFIGGDTIPNIDTTSISVFVVANGAPGASANLYGMFNINAYTNGFCLDRQGWDGKLSIYNNGNIVYTPSGTLPNAGYNYKILEAVKKYNIETELFINGNSQASSTNSLLNGPFTNADYVIGHSQTSYGEYFKGEIAEILVYKKSLNAVDRQSVENYLRMKYARKIDLGPDIAAYGFHPLTLNAHSGFTNYLWNDGSTDSTLSAITNGTYWVQASDIFGYPTSDTVHITYPNTRLNYQNDTLICFGSDLFLQSLITNKSNYAFLWSNGSTDTVINVSAGGSYWVKITDTLGYFAYSDTVQVAIDSFALHINLGNDTSFCSGNFLGIQPPLGNSGSPVYTWPDGSHDTTLVVTASGSYHVSVTNQSGCTGTDTVHVTITGTAPTTLFDADTVCFGDNTVFADLSTVQPGDTLVTWHWQFTANDTSNLQNPIFAFPAYGIHSVTLTAYTTAGCAKSYTKNVLVYPVPVPAFSADISCINNPLQFADTSSVVPGDTITSWDWDFGDSSPHSNMQHPVHVYMQVGNYPVTLIVQTQNGCQRSVTDSIEVVSFSALPAVPQSLSPANSAIVSDTGINFSWAPSQNSVRYKIIIASDAAFSNLLADSIVYSPGFYWAFSAANQAYYWKVIAYNICSDSVVTPIHAFEIFYPGLISGLSLWLKADAGPLLNGSNVFQWNDYSGNSNNAVQSIVVSQPMLVSDALNGLPVVRFDGVNDFIGGDTIPNIDTTSISVFVVANGAPGASANLYGMFNINAYTNGFCLDRQGWDGKLSIYNNGNIVYTPSGTLPNAGYNYKILEAVKKYNIETELFINGNSQASSTNSLLNGPFTNADYVIGYSQGWAYLYGDIAEILVYKQALSTTDRQDIEDYLWNKYAAPPVELGPDISIAYGMCDVIFDAGGRYNNFLWSTGDTTQ